MACPKCYQSPCRCGVRPLPPPQPIISPRVGTIGTVGPTGLINAPGQPFHGRTVEPGGHIPGTGFVIGPDRILRSK